MKDGGTDALEAALGKQIRIELLERDMTQQDLADAMGMERATMSRYMRGHRSMTLRTYSKLADTLGVPPDQLMARAMRRVEA
ncbi:helix-turn-helix domain-containing protein [Sinomonas gamaensis]|uniref:helix-turn-helix domain-containing protein n=1 Tax=Sinomonas gamaensis TaxID=2565624 RepID=UPI001485E180|nr:helix-turn-helix transcriptional regulator [Sinomonas gamaensis]